MIQEYKGPFQYDETIISDWKSTATGVYYCGYINEEETLIVHYVGKATSENGIRGRLLDHLREDDWSDVTHFGYRVCTTAKEAENLEASEIKRLQPKYNTQGK